MLPWSLQASM